ncbi:hypothetical protein SAMN02745781_03750 [Vibrio gazogenes DSM 21264]|uniref:Uncharacterized protein n=1 Tax=Vibrio gazogenes DSM 21264 = NBRC 103151 TaxID=1123492 RepID=A0A1M5GCB9_VIBGA|nr:hypothetical protein SAMN02745781_03750 [Vibrio gazogenes DSM 21264] [Vibrio gazogenes DSM 21264 = NBRC 103151]SJN55059.1 hypothetical protein BQ6471_01351 [Vibrio gazogenes]
MDVSRRAVDQFLYVVNFHTFFGAFAVLLKEFRLFSVNQNKIDLFQKLFTESHYSSSCHLVSRQVNMLSKMTLPFEG